MTCVAGMPTSKLNWTDMNISLSISIYLSLSYTLLLPTSFPSVYVVEIGKTLRFIYEILEEHNNCFICVEPQNWFSIENWKIGKLEHV